jgi:hypothetical protein
MGGRHSIAGMTSQSNVKAYRCENKTDDRVDEPEPGDSSEVDLPDRPRKMAERSNQKGENTVRATRLKLWNLKLDLPLISV